MLDLNDVTRVSGSELVKKRLEKLARLLQIIIRMVYWLGYRLIYPIYDWVQYRDKLGAGRGEE